MKLKGLRKANIAELAGVSRAAVTKWFEKGKRKDWVNVESKTLIQLALALNLSPEVFLKRRPNLYRLKTRFLWDALYPDMESFLEAISQKRLVAIARLVQVLGFREGSSVGGKIVFAKFNEYKKYIKPVRRRELEILWPLYHSKR